MSELKPCPFCGGRAQLCHGDRWNGRDYWAFVRCEKCHITPFMECSDKKATRSIAVELAAELWNTRPADAVRDGVVIPNAVVQFLLGAAPIDGKWFGDLHPKHPGRLWWRRLLRAALAQDGRG